MISREKENEVELMVENYLDTRDKRFMFLKCFFPKEIKHINLEGTPLNVSYNMVKRFSQQSERYFNEFTDKLREVFE